MKSGRPVRSRTPKLEALFAESDRLLERMQSPNSRCYAVGIEASPEELGRVACEAACWKAAPSVRTRTPKVLAKK